MLLNFGNLICAHADFAKFIYEILGICSQQKRKKIHVCLGKSEYHKCFFPFALRCTFTFGIFLEFDLGPLALISILFINIAVVI